MKLALAQMRMAMDKKTNERKAMEQIETARLQEADLLLFPEIQLTPFFPQYPGAILEGMGIRKEAFSIPAEDPLIGKFQEKARSAGMYLAPNFYVREADGRLFDRSYFIDPEGELLGTQDMVHIHSAEHFFETDYYTPSESGFRVFDTPFGRIGIVVCFDRHLPESIRSAALQGASIVLIPTANLATEPLDIFRCELRAAAYENNVFIAMANRTGEEDGITFAGDSIVVSPEGEILSEGGPDEETVFCEIDPGEAVRSRSQRNYISHVIPDKTVYHMAGEAEDISLPVIRDLYHAMAEYDRGDPKRIQHFTKVWTYAKMIGEEEGLSLREQTILEMAAILHDIGIHKAEKDFGSTAGPLQERLGPGEADPILRSLDVPPDIMERVKYLIGHHHTYHDIDGKDYQILVEADFLVNLLEDDASPEAAEEAFQRIFKTDAGKKLFREMYPGEKEGESIA